MKDHGWYEKDGVKILEGKWQDLLGSEHILGVGGFDVIYIDTFSEDYGDLHQFFEHLPNILAGPDSRFSFFHGLGATSKAFLYSCCSLLNA
jgi:type IV protein arginine methyltransferase